MATLILSNDQRKAVADRPAAAWRSWLAPLFIFSLALAYGGGLWLHLLHDLEGAHERYEIAPVLHWLRDSSLALPAVLLAVGLGMLLWRRLSQRLTPGLSRLALALILGLSATLAFTAGVPVHAALFSAEHHHADEAALATTYTQALELNDHSHAGEAEETASSPVDMLLHSLKDGLAGLPVNLGIALFATLLLGKSMVQENKLRRMPRRLLPEGPRWYGRLPFKLATTLALFVLVPALVLTFGGSQPATAAVTCTRTVFADVVALDQQFFYNRLGAWNPAGIIYALRRDVVDNNTGLTEAQGGTLVEGQVALRADKRPRPLVLRANIGDCLEIRFTNLLNPIAIGGQPADRTVGIHVNGLELVTSINDDGSFVGLNPPLGNGSGLVAPGQTSTYKLYAQYENTFLLYNMGGTAGGEGGNGTMSYGLFGAVNVEPSDSTNGSAATWQSEWYRSQLTRVEMDWATTGLTPDGHPILNYDAVYPAGAGFGKDGLPIIKMLAPKAGYAGEIVHSDINAIITGPGRDDFPAGYYDPNAVYGSQDRNEPFREFTVIFHDEIFALQAFANLYEDPELAHALAIVKDGFAINYGTGGIGSEIIANRLGLGPMANCVECKYEEFFLTSFTVGDPAMIVDNVADPAQNVAGLPATKALYPDDPSNVHHSYLNDHVKFRQLHAGTEHHIFHLHAHQWQYNWNDPNSNYLDSQGIGPGSGFTYEIAYGGSGNRNKTPGDAIFHCHFYPHFAMGMWELWRVHDTFEQGTELDALTGLPVAGARALPDGEITAGTPIPGVVPLPSSATSTQVKALAPMPDPAASVVAWDEDGAGPAKPTSQLDLDANGVADFAQDLNGDLIADPFMVVPAKNPGYPFFIPGISGHRPPTPALDIIDTDADGVIEDGGLPRHIITGGPNLNPFLGPVTHEQFQTRLDFNKELLDVGFTTVPEAGTPAEQLAMAFHGTLWQPSYLADGTPIGITAATLDVGSANGGTFTLSVDAAITTAIAWNASAADIQTALSTAGVAASVSGTGTTADPWVISVNGNPTIALNNAGLTQTPITLASATLPSTSEVVHVNVGSADGGTFTLSVDTATTGAIAWNALAADVQNALSTVGVTALVSGAGTIADPWVIGLSGTPAVSIDGVGLTEGGGATLATAASATVASTSEVAHVNVGSADGGTFTLSVDTATTGAIAWNTLAADVQNALSTAGVAALVSGAGTIADPWVIGLSGIPAVSIDGAGLTQTPITAASLASNSNIKNAANGRPIQGFETNGLPAQPGAPFANPCRTDPTVANGWVVGDIPQSKIYKGVNIQFDMVMNKVGWHFQQQRILTLWDDAMPVLAGAKAPEPLVMRLNAGDCASYWHANLVPNVYELDDYQVRTPTDIIGQHIHLVKFDVTASDGSANGFNYEDGTLSPMEVQERIHAIRTHNVCAAGVVSAACPEATIHPFFGPGPDGNGDGVGDWVGARTTVQRWYADPVLNNSWDNGLGTVFTHDHYGPSTHQQVGLYATVLVEPTGAQYRDPETGVMMGTRHDGGPTSWRADILNVTDATGKDMSHREFYFEFADFQHAYKAGGGVRTMVPNGELDALGNLIMIPSYADFANAINPSFRVMPPAGFEDALYFFPPVCPNGAPRPCPEAISGADPGTYVTNYRNEPISERVYDPLAKAQAAGQAGDLAYAYSSLVQRVQAALNAPFAAYPPLTADVGAGDPATPLLRVYMGDKVRLRVQVGAHEDEHNFMIHGLKWNKEPLTQNSGWKNSEFLGISEYSMFEMPVVPDTGAGDPAKIDYFYTMGAQLEDNWNGIWGLLRSYGKPRNDLLALPNNPIGTGIVINNAAQFNQMCPVSAPVVNLKVTAVRAADVLPGGSLVYNTRNTVVNIVDPLTGLPVTAVGRGPLHDPSALMYFRDSDLTYDPVTHKPNGLKPGVPVEPLILRARAGDCLNVQLTNALPANLTWTDPNGITRPDMPGFSTLPPITHKDIVADPVLGAGIITFNANDLTPSSVVGLHPQLLAYNIRTSDGFAAGGTSLAIVVPPGGSKTYRWYAGDVDAAPDTSTTATNDYNLVATPVEFGATGLLPADRIKGSNKGLVGALIIEPQGSTWVEDPISRASATVTKADGVTKFRDFVVILQNDLNLRYTADNVTCTPALANLFCGVRNITAEGGFAVEDPQDSAQKAINYGADPVWFRLGVAPENPFNFLLPITDIHRVFSNGLAGVDNPATTLIENDPQTAVFVASNTGPQEVRMRIVAPGGHARGIVFTLHGHAWQREPYINNSTEIGENAHGWWNGAQEGIGAGSLYNIPVQRGGLFNVTGDFLFRDLAPFGSYQGLWGIFRHNGGNAPMAGADFYATPKNVVLNIAAPGVLANDVDLDGDEPTAQLVGAGTTTAGGTVTLYATGSFSYTPPLNFAGLDTFQYQACGGGACSDPATVSVTVGNAPAAVNDAYSMVFDSTGTASLTIAAPGVLANDSDPDGDPLVVGEVNGSAANVSVAITLTSGGTVTVNADGSLTYTPTVGFIGTTSFTYRACEAIPAPFLCSNLATVTLKVNAPPTATDNSFSGKRNRTLSVGKPGVLAGDTDPNGDALKAVLATGPASGTLNLRPDGSFSYNPPRDFTGTVTFTYKACEAATPEQLCSNIATVTITITR